MRHYRCWHLRRRRNTKRSSTLYVHGVAIVHVFLYILVLVACPRFISGLHGDNLSGDLLVGSLFAPCNEQDLHRVTNKMVLFLLYVKAELEGVK
jgi:hypothetical protein